MRWLKRGRRARMALLGLVVGACSPTTMSKAPSVPGAVLGTDGDAPGGAVAAPGSPVGGSEPFDLERFTPLLALPELAPAREAVDAGDAALAATEVRRVLSSRRPTGVEALRYEYLVARLEEAAGRLDSAIAGYQRAASADWLLRDYARLGHARTLLATGKTAAALATLAELPDVGVVADRARPLLVEATEQEGQLDRAVELLRVEANRSASRREHAALARLLLTRIDKEPVRPAAARVADAREALLHAETAALGLGANSTDARAARELAKRATELLPANERSVGLRSPELELSHIEGLDQAGYTEEALAAADALEARLEDKLGVIGCRLAYARSKMLAGQRKWNDAADALGEPSAKCNTDPEVRARLLFLAGKYAHAAERYAAAARYYEMLEREFPKHRLADDARLKRAQSYQRMGVEARFTELLQTMPEDYPAGDMTMDGVLELSMRRIEKQDWSGAASVLERGVALVRNRDSARGTEYSGRERYFLARARFETGARAQALDEYAAIIRELPLSYYMLHAYSRLLALDPARAQASLEEGLRHASEKPFAFAMRPEFERVEFKRALELLRVGDVAGGKSELSALRLTDGADAALLWGIALLYDRAGAAGVSHGIARGQLTDWFGHWPIGAWRAAWELGFPRPYAKIVERESKRSSVPEWFIYAVMREESAFDPEAQSPARAYGLMQLIVPTAKMYAKRLGLPYEAPALRRPAINVALGSNVLRDLTERFEKNPLLAIPGYNAGPGRPARWLRERPQLDFDVWVELIPLLETRRYTKRVLASRAAYAYLYHAEDAERALRLPLRLEAP